jgi:xylan 1,4-beta-xylosidase
MIWNFEDGVEEDVNPRRFVIRVRGFGKGRRYRIVHYRIDGEHSNAYRAWSDLGKPPQPDMEQVRVIRERENLQLAAPVAGIDMRDPLPIALELPDHAVSLVVLVPESRKAPQPPSWISGERETGASGRAQIFLAWNPSPEPDFLHYRLWGKYPGEKEYRNVWDHSSFNTAVFLDTEATKAGIYHYRLQAVNASNVASAYSGGLTVRVS